MQRVQEIIEFWFNGLNDDFILDQRSPVLKRWFAKNDNLDAEIRERFESDLEKASRGQYPFWLTFSEGQLALILLFDQFARNIYRNTPQMFSTDPLALRITLQTIDQEDDLSLPLIQRLFFYMPLMHAEDKDVQKLSVKHFQNLVTESQKRNVRNTAYYEYTLGFAQKHQDIIARFGRFPHRNHILQRVSTPDEMIFLKRLDSIS